MTRVAMTQDPRVSAKSSVGSGPVAAFTESFESAEQTVGSGTTTIAHGLSRTPTLVQIIYRCNTANFGYSVGEEVWGSSYAGEAGSGAFPRNCSASADGTSVYLAQPAGALHLLRNRSSGAFSQISNGNWRIVVRAWA